MFERGPAKRPARAWHPSMPDDEYTDDQLTQEVTELRTRVKALEDFRVEYEQRQWSLQRLATVLHDSSDAISVLDVDGQILEWNPAAERIDGDTKTEARGMNVRQLIPAASYPKEQERMMAVSRGMTLAPYETQRVTKRGLLLDSLRTMTKMAAQAGRADSISSTERNLTGWKRPANTDGVNGHS